MLPASSSFWGPHAVPGWWPRPSSLCLGCHVTSFSLRASVSKMDPTPIQDDFILADDLCRDPISREGHTHRSRGPGPELATVQLTRLQSLPVTHLVA